MYSWDYKKIKKVLKDKRKKKNNLKPKPSGKVICKRMLPWGQYHSLPEPRERPGPERVDGGETWAWAWEMGKDRIWDPTPMFYTEGATPWIKRLPRKNLPPIKANWWGNLQTYIKSKLINEDNDADLLRASLNSNLHYLQVWKCLANESGLGLKVKTNIFYRKASSIQTFQDSHKTKK